MIYSPFPKDMNNRISVYAFSGRNDRNMSFFYGDQGSVLENRKNFLGPLGIDYKSLVCAEQVHGNNVRYITEEEKGKGAFGREDSLPATDAFITDKRNVPLAIFTADCLSIFIIDIKRPAVGLVHAGWRSTKEKITELTVNSMVKNFNSDPRELFVGLGPCIRNCCYKVGEEFDSFFKTGVIRRGSDYFLDLVGINTQELIDSGVNKKNIFDCGICTFCRSSQFYSFRLEDKTCGRMISVIMLR